MKPSAILGILIHLGVIHHVYGKSKSITVIRLDRFGSCDNTKHAVWYNVSGVEPVGKTSEGYGTIIVERTINELSKATATINRCRDQADLQSCELFQTWRFTSNICGLLLMKNVVWSPLFTYTPPVGCPLKKGVYSIRHATVDVRKLAVIKFPTDGYWRVTVNVEENGEKIYCLFFSGKFTRIRA